MKKNLVTDEKTSEMTEALKPLGFVANGKHIRIFTHAVLNRQFDFTAHSIEGAVESAVVIAFNMGVNAGVEANQRRICENLGLG